MGANLRLLPTASYADAMGAWLAADYEQCLVLLDGAGTCPEYNLFKARVLLRLGRTEDALRLLAEKMPSKFEATRISIIALARAQVGELTDAASCLDRASEAIQTGNQREEIQYARGVVAWMLRDHAQVERIVQSILKKSMTYRAEAYHLMGLSLSARERYIEAAVAFQNAVESAGRDNFVRASALAPLASFARELARGDVIAAIVECESAKILWTPGIARHRFPIERCLAWYYASHGSLRTTLSGLRRAMKIAPTDAARVVALCDRAFIALRFDSSGIGLDLLDEACDLADEICWNDVGEERLALLQLSQMLASKEVMRAIHFLKIYDDLGDASPKLALYRDVRTQAQERLTRAAIAQALGNKTQASRLYGEAFSIYRRIGYVFRAVMVATARYDISATARPGLRDYVQKVASQLPHSWMRRQAEHSVAIGGLESSPFTARQIEVIREFARTDGTNREIARALGMSVNTVKDHMKEIRTKAGVRNRTGLRAYCVKMGLID